MEDSQQSSGEQASTTVSPRLLAAGLLIGVWAMLPPFVGPGFTTTGLQVEVVDHPVPALVLLAVVAWTAWRKETRPLWLFGGGLLISLAGIWMVATHAPLVLQAVRGQVGWLATTNHASPPVAVLTLGAVWTWRWW